MSIVLALALLAPSSLALGVVGEGDAAPLRQALVRELGQRTEAPVVPVELEGDCAEPELCLERLRAAAHADQAVLVRVFAGVSRVRISVHHSGLSLPFSQTATVADLGAGPDRLARSLAERLFPLALTAAPEARGGAAPWVVFGVGCAAAIAGGIVVGTASLVANPSGEVLLPAELDTRAAQLRTQRGVGIGLSAAGVAAMVIGALWGL
jgi:hypothetical protein